MQANVKADSNSLLHKMITIVFLPIIVIVWMTGWTLMQIGSVGRPIEVKQKTSHIPPGFEANEKSEIPKVKEDSKLTNKPITA